jgi:hypothetical protein
MPPQSACEGIQSFLPRDDDTLLAIQLPLPEQEATLAVQRPSYVKETEPYANQ